MKKARTRNALIVSCMSMLLCAAMLIGTTFAWFTDTASTGVNKIQAGNLDIQILNANGDEVTNLGWVAKDGRDQDDILWEPGATYQLESFKIKNNGNLALKFKFEIVGLSGDAKLMEVIDFSYTTDTGTPYDVTEEYKLAAGATTELITLTGHMKKEAGNEYQGLSLENIAITVFATQDTVEYDSFTNEYDIDAQYLNTDADGNYLISNADELVYFASEVNKKGNSFSGKTVKLTADIDLGGRNWTPIGRHGSTCFVGTFDGQGHTIKNMTVNNPDIDGNCASGFFGYGGVGITVKDVKFDNAKVTGNHDVGVVVGYLYGTIEGCEVKNSTVIANNANDDANGDKVGGIVGYVGEGSTIKNNKVSNCNITGNRDIGGIAGAVIDLVTFTGNSVTNTTIQYESDKIYGSAGALVSGRTGFVPDTTNNTNNVSVTKNP